MRVCWRRRAYPRSRGATETTPEQDKPEPGLSPLARGNLLNAERGVVHPGPIPARAGQPRADRLVGQTEGAYPRSRGATSRMAISSSRVHGLSPLARGNHPMTTHHTLGSGPIPARAGQPQSSARARCRLGAYPRSRGATRSTRTKKEAATGLSPLARGNRRPLALPVVLPGPIPARAGQPRLAARRPVVARAYPRSRGATAIAWGAMTVRKGLSPLARGNHAI